MVFDAHADIWTDITHHYLAGERNIFRKYHYDRLKKGNIEGGIFVIWNDPPYDEYPLKRTYQMMEAIRQDTKDCADVLKIACKFEDIDIAKKEEKIYTFIGLEGLKSIGKNIDLIDEFYNFGIRHMGLTWNEQNDLATGVKGEISRGITNLGKKAVKKIQDKGILLDTSHLNDKSFWDLMRIATGPVVATHSNCRELCNNMRNLSDEQLKVIADSGGIVGVNAFNQFISEEIDKQNINVLIEHLIHMIEIMGIEHVGFGFDFSEFLDLDTLKSFSDQVSPSTKGLEDASKVPVLLDLLKSKGFSKDEVNKIAFKNWQNVINKVLKNK